MNEIKFYGRGGQGVVMASQLLGFGYFKAGLYPQCYSLFGGERRGAPVVSFLRVDMERILLKCDIKKPHELIYFDPQLVDIEEIKGLMVQGGKILISTGRSGSYFQGMSDYTLGLIDAPSIVRNLGLGHMINTTILGAYCRLSGELSMDHLIAAIKEMVPAKLEANVKAALEGYEKLVIYQGEN
jgi:2-oxoacid:acceptor oxidoreductase gamma subunit (pyruvate/2-ketoisovalerate family)